VAFTYLKVKSVPLFTSGGLGLSVKNLVLFTSLSAEGCTSTSTKTSKLVKQCLTNLLVFVLVLVLVLLQCKQCDKNMKLLCQFCHCSSRKEFFVFIRMRLLTLYCIVFISQ